eukprot:5244022-Pyramimonas_sp.AAC.1
MMTCSWFPGSLTIVLIHRRRCNCSPTAVGEMSQWLRTTRAGMVRARPPSSFIAALPLMSPRSIFTITLPRRSVKSSGNTNAESPEIAA